MNIINIRRSGDQFENMTVQVGWQTTNEELDRLEKAINGWLATDEHRDLASSTAIMVCKLLVLPLDTLEVLIEYRFHTSSQVQHIELTIGIQYVVSLSPIQHDGSAPSHVNSSMPSLQFIIGHLARLGISLWFVHCLISFSLPSHPIKLTHFPREMTQLVVPVSTPPSSTT
jgi:hypothetical protein